MARKDDLIAVAEAAGLKVSKRMTIGAIEAMIEADGGGVPKGGSFQFQSVERPASKRGRKPVAKPGMVALAQAWDTIPVKGTVILPDHDGGNEHAALALSRHHFKTKAAGIANLKAGVDYTIQGSDEHGAVITRLR